MTDARPNGCRKGQMKNRMLERTDEGQDGCRTGQMQDRTDAG